MNDELQNILSRTEQIRYGAFIQTTLNYLRGSQEAGGMAKTDKHFKKEETKRLIQFIENNSLWISGIDLNSVWRSVFATSFF